MRKFLDFLILKDFYHRIFHDSAVNLNYLWNFGILAMLCLIIQLITGIFLAMYYTSDINLAFFSVEYIMRNVNYGWLLRYIHLNCASMFFIVVYLHIFRGLFYGSYLFPREIAWFIGVFIFFIMIVTAFLGYSLPWGQMSFWAATVITNLVSAIPFFGKGLVIWLWGGYSVGNSTLGRFFSLHFFLPFVILIFVILHIFFVQQVGSNNPFGLQLNLDNKSFYPYYLIKDLNGVLIFLEVFIIFVFFCPNFLGHSDNYIVANPLVTPTHIVPEWYFLPLYAILRSIPDKLGGVCCMLLAVLILLYIPFFFGFFIKSYSFRITFIVT